MAIVESVSLPDMWIQQRPLETALREHHPRVATIVGALSFVEREHVLQEFTKNGGVLIVTESISSTIPEVAGVIFYDLPLNPRFLTHESDSSFVLGVRDQSESSHSQTSLTLLLLSGSNGSWQTSRTPENRSFTGFSLPWIRGFRNCCLLRRSHSRELTDVSLVVPLGGLTRWKSTQ